jgi:hypothetical protein
LEIANLLSWILVVAHCGSESRYRDLHALRRGLTSPHAKHGPAHLFAA